jgi:predicted acylesterase/phospholipase RssA
MEQAELPYGRACTRFPVMNLSAGTCVRMATAMLLFCWIAAPLPMAAQTLNAELSGQQKRKPAAKPAPAAGPKKKAGPIPREGFTLAEQNLAAIPDIPDARFFADSETDFLRAAPAAPGAWLALSSGGADGAFGAGVLTGLAEAGKRPDFVMVTGVSTGALMAPFVFLGAKYDAALRDAYTTINATDIFELGGKGESFFDTWPLKDLIAKRVTPELLSDVAAEHRRGRRLLVLTSSLDAERPTAWNMGAIAAKGGDKALKLFRDILLAAGSIPGAFPPVLIDVEAGGRKFQEMHADGGLNYQFFIAPASMMTSNATTKIPATDLYVIINTTLTSAFQVIERDTLSILNRGVSVGVKTLTRIMIDQAYAAARRNGIGFHLATIDPKFNAPSRGAFDTDYMKALFDFGFQQGKSGKAFVNEPRN